MSAPNQSMVLYRGGQDNSNSRYDGTGPWTTVVDGDGTLNAVDPTNATIAYAGRPQGFIFKTTDGGSTWRPITGFQGDPASDGRVEFVTPFVLDPSRPQRLLIGAYRLWESTDGGSSWHITAAGQDLSTTGSDAITTLAIAPSAASTIFAGTSDGNVQVTTNDGATWTNGTGLPGRWVTSATVNPMNPAVAWAGISGFNAATPSLPGHIFQITNGGQTWHNVSGNLPDAPVNALAVDPTGATLYVGTDAASWRRQRDVTRRCHGVWRRGRWRDR